MFINFLLLGLHIVLTVVIKRIMLCYVTVISFMFNSHCRTRRDAKKQICRVGSGGVDVGHYLIVDSPSVACV